MVQFLWCDSMTRHIIMQTCSLKLTAATAIAIISKGKNANRKRKQRTVWMMAWLRRRTNFESYHILLYIMSQNINSTTRHLKFCFISIFANLLRTKDNETKSAIIHFISLLFSVSVRRRFVQNQNIIKL